MLRCYMTLILIFVCRIVKDRNFFQSLKHNLEF